MKFFLKDDKNNTTNVETTKCRFEMYIPYSRLIGLIYLIISSIIFLLDYRSIYPLNEEGRNNIRIKFGYETIDFYSILE